MGWSGGSLVGASWPYAGQNIHSLSKVNFYMINVGL